MVWRNIFKHFLFFAILRGPHPSSFDTGKFVLVPFIFPDRNMKLFIGSLPYTVTEAELTELCGQYGTVVSTKLILDPFSGQPKGFGFVEMATRSEGHKVMEGLNGVQYNHRTLVCNEAKPPARKGARRR